ncbi:Hsp70 family protein [Bryobacter aggregatus]|uniref:Hsp70 family protein n=1 Tax=Bryobacter aggregatus TaxID=360054 RepID=UPI000AA23169|nr:Hsp70 family protein [Bryobacter aggregatus]
MVSWVDRGNYPLASFDCADGASRDWFPALAAFAEDGSGARAYGWDAWMRQAETGWIFVRSLKRLLSDSGPNTAIRVGAQRFPALEIYRELASALKHALLSSSSMEIPPGEELEVILGVPAHANSNQRFLTAEAFRLAGFQVLAMLNEPSAAAIEFGHRNKMTKDKILVYDLGGGTFDASIVAMTETERSVLWSEGIATLGGDEFDLVLAEMALESIAKEASDFDQQQWFSLVEACREKKEALHPNTRKIEIEGEGWTARLAVADYYERAWPLVAETMHATNDLLQLAGGLETIEAVYVTGGGSELPLISRQLREEYGRKVKRSAYMRAATAIGLAIHADQQSGYTLREHAHQYFGVWREADQGSRVVFDPIFSRGMQLPAAGEAPLTVRRLYQPVHNVGHFRFLESTRISEEEQPAGEISYWDEILFPFDPALEDVAELSSVFVEHSERAAACQIEETYHCDANGKVSVEIQNLSTGHRRLYPLARWGRKEEVVAAEKTTKRRKKAAKA